MAKYTRTAGGGLRKQKSGTVSREEEQLRQTEEAGSSGSAAGALPPQEPREGEALRRAEQELLQRQEFSYDPGEDPLYQQMLGQYVRQGQMAMEDTLGRAQSMTGGYGNSYAQSAAQQTYQGYLQQAAQALPEYYQLALDRYDRQGQSLMDRYGILRDREQQEYDRYRDQLADYYAQLDRQQSQFNLDREYDYRLGRDQVSDSQWQSQFDESRRQWEYTQGIADADGNRIPEPVWVWRQPQQTQQEPQAPEEAPQMPGTVHLGAAGDGGVYQRLLAAFLNGGRRV